MKFGIDYFPDVHPDRVSGQQYFADVLDAFGISMDESRARFEEGIEAITRLWTEETVTFEGKFHRFKNVTSLPRPTQQPHPPIWVAAVVTPESFVWTGARGYNLMV